MPGVKGRSEKPISSRGRFVRKSLQHKAVAAAAAAASACRRGLICVGSRGKDGAQVPAVNKENSSGSSKCLSQRPSSSRGRLVRRSLHTIQEEEEEEEEEAAAAAANPCQRSPSTYLCMLPCTLPCTATFCAQCRNNPPFFTHVLCVLFVLFENPAVHSAPVHAAVHSAPAF
jgi:hypothetical protein